MKKLLILLFLTSLTTLVLGQRNLKNGFVVLNNNDTLRGLINYKEWHRNPNFIEFLLDSNSESQNFQVNEITYFEVSGFEAYKKHRVKISLDDEKFSEYKFKGTTNKTESVLLKVQQKGKNISLFSYRDEIKLRWYISYPNQISPQELLNSEYKMEGMGGLVAHEYQYRSQLTRLAEIYSPNNEKLIKYIDKAGYTRKSLMKICLRINGLNQSESNAVVQGQESQLKFYIGAGVYQNSIEISGDFRFAGHNPPKSMFPAINVGMDIIPVPTIGRLYIRNSVGFSGFNFETASDTEDYFQFSETYYLRLKQINFNLHSQLSYNLYNTSRFKWALGAGGGLNVSSYPVNDEVFVRRGTPSHTNVKNDYVEPLKSMWFNLSLRSGIVIKPFEFALTYYPRTTISNSPLYSIQNSALNVAVNYWIKSK